MTSSVMVTFKNVAMTSPNAYACVCQISRQFITVHYAIFMLSWYVDGGTVAIKLCANQSLTVNLLKVVVGGSLLNI